VDGYAIYREVFRVDSRFKRDIGTAAGELTRVFEIEESTRQ
jgi:hypothetical protein